LNEVAGAPAIPAPGLHHFPPPFCHPEDACSAFGSALCLARET
jgi:hypothetical protein